MWIMNGAFAGIVAGTFALTFAGIPLMLDLWKEPIRETFPLWFVTSIACAFTLAGSDWTLAAIFLPLSSLIWNGILSAIVLRRKRVFIRFTY